MANGILDALAKHGMFSETLDALNKDPSTAHQMKGFDFAQNFPGAVPGGINTPASFLGPMAAKGYQYGQELSRAMLDGLGGITISDALSRAKAQSDANIQGMAGKGFDMDTYNQNVKDFNIADVTFANSFGLNNPFNSSAMANEPTGNVIGTQNPTTDFDFNTARALENRAALNRAGLMSLDDAGLTINPYEDFAQVAKPGFNFNRAGNFLTNLKDKGLDFLKDKGLDFLGSGKELALRGIGSILGGPVGGFIGGALANLKESPTDKFNLEIGKEFGDRYGYKSDLSSGNLGSRQDPFGRNLVSFARNYEKNRIAEIARLSALKNLTKFQQDKLDFGKEYLEKLEEKRQAKIDDMFARGQGGSGQDFTGGRFDRAGSREAYDKDPTGFSGSS